MKAQVNFDALGGGGSVITPTITERYTDTTYSATIPLDSSKHYIVNCVYIRTYGESQVMYIENNTLTVLADYQNTLTVKPTFAISNGNLTISVSTGSYRWAITIVQLD